MPTDQQQLRYRSLYYYPEKPHRQNRGGQGEKSGTTRRWRRKTLKLLKTDSEMAPVELAAIGKEKLRKSALKPLE